MKVGIIGSGMVGSTAAYAIMLRKAAGEVVLIDKNKKRANAEAADIQHAVPFVHSTNIYSGDYSDLKDAKIVVISAGASQKPGETRLQLMERNALILNDIISNTVKYNSKCVFLLATNPVDIITQIATKIAEEHGIPSSRVIGTGTTLDTARFRSLLGNKLGVDPQNVHGYVIGEHGDSEVLTWSNVDIGGVSLNEFVRYREIDFSDEIRDQIDSNVRNAAYKIIEGKGSTYFGIGGAISRIVDVINRDNRAVLTVSTLKKDVEGIKNVTLSLPHLIGGEGNLGVLPVKVSSSEKEFLRKSAEIIKTKIDEYEK